MESKKRSLTYFFHQILHLFLVRKFRLVYLITDTSPTLHLDSLGILNLHLLE
nr:MAG TPA: hypothetical protein [Caudoviricetes sp.]